MPVQRTALFGNINAFAYYFAELLVGSPPQPVSVIMDTGSALCGFPCKGCTHCGHHLDPLFDMKASNTSKMLPCGLGCDQCSFGHCGYRESYTEGSSISGIWFRDLVLLQPIQVKKPDEVANTPVVASMGCHRDERKLFYTQKVNGILGLAPHSITKSSNVLKDLFKAEVNHEIFAICLAEWGGLLTVGGYDADLSVGRLQWLPLHHTGYFGVGLQQLSCEEQKVGAPSDFGTTVLDTGTTFTYFPEPVYQAMRLALKTHCIGLKCDATAVGDNCWKLQSKTLRFPNVSLAFTNGMGEMHIPWPAEAYMFRRGEGNVWCYAFASNGMSRETVLGISFFVHKNVVFDTSKSRLGIAAAHCPENHYKGPQPVPQTAPLEQASAYEKALEDAGPLEGTGTSQHTVAVVLGSVGAFLLLVAVAMCMCAYSLEEPDEESGQKLALWDTE